jgi:AcrR family transcriptional regulator
MKSYHHGNLKQELIDCACKLCERDGYTKLSIRSLAKESGVSQTAPYRHFETKETLYASVATEVLRNFQKLAILKLIKKLRKSILLK